MATTTRKMTDNPIVLRIVELLEKKGLNDKDLTDHLGISPGTMAKWKYDGSTVYLKHIVQICEYLETTPNYLFLGTYGEEEMDGLDPAEQEVLQMFRKMDEGRKQCIRSTMKYLSEK